MYHNNGDRTPMSKRAEAWFLAAVVSGLVVLFLLGRAIYGAPAPLLRTGPITRAEVVGDWRGVCSSWPILFNLAADGVYRGQWENTSVEGPKRYTWFLGSWSLCGDAVVITETYRLGFNQPSMPCLYRWSFRVVRHKGKVYRDSGRWRVVLDERRTTSDDHK